MRRHYKKYSRRGRSRTRKRAINQNDLVFIGKFLAFAFIAVLALSIIIPTLSFLMDNSWIIILVSVFMGLAIFGVIFYKLIDKKYEKFILNHSLAIKSISEINSRYVFDDVQNLDMINSYDNENFYYDISTLDYLTYQLVYIRKSAIQSINSAEKNGKLFLEYENLVKEIQDFDKYDTDKLPIFKGFCKAKEKKIFNKLIQQPDTVFEINVTLTLTNINGAYKDSKSESFNSDKITSIIEKISHKNGDFFTDEDVWGSICRVERGKVTNKIRFAVYGRDGNRCRRCGSTHDLEIDHIFPISKGGKSNFENLQTLCHDCNVAKSNTVEPGTPIPTIKPQNSGNTCKLCGAPLVLKKGKYGQFYGCTNYPTCKFTKNI